MFLFGGSSAVSDIQQVTGTLKSSLLRFSLAYQHGLFDIKMYDNVFGEKISQHFVVNKKEQKYLNAIADWEREQDEDYEQPPSDEDMEDDNDGDDDKDGKDDDDDNFDDEEDEYFNQIGEKEKEKEDV